jgi:hypothetical protein
MASEHHEIRVTSSWKGRVHAAITRVACVAQREPPSAQLDEAERTHADRRIGSQWRIPMRA